MSQETLMNLKTDNLKLNGFDITPSYTQANIIIRLSDELNDIDIILYSRKVFPETQYLNIGISTKEYTGMIERNTFLENAVLNVMNNIYKKESSSTERELILKAEKVIKDRLYEDLESEIWLRGRKPVSRGENIPNDMKL